MSAAQHTPGPWSVEARFGWYHISSEHSIGGELCKSGRQAICAMTHEGKRGSTAYREMFAANARLIAAAPELLDALQMLTRGYGVTFQDQALRSFAQDAIAKATGGTT